MIERVFSGAFVSLHQVIEQHLIERGVGGHFHWFDPIATESQ